MNFKKIKRLMALGTAVIMTVSALAACGNNEQKESSNSSGSSSQQTTSGSSSQQTSQANASDVSSVPSEDTDKIVFPLEETMEFSALVNVPADASYSDNTAWNYILDRANIKVDMTEVANSEHREKGNLLLSSGNYPDFLFKCSGLDMNSFGMDGVLIPLEDLIREYAPNLTALLDEKDSWDLITASDGHIYSLPFIERNKSVIGGDNMWINKRWLDNLGLEVPDTWEELYNALKAFKEQDANGNGDPDDEIPLTFYGGMIPYLMSYLPDGLHYYNYTNADYCAIIDDEFVFYPLTEGYRDNWLAEVAKWYKEGLIDPNGFTQSKSEMEAVGKSGDIVGSFWRASASLVPEEYQMDYAAVPALNGIGLPVRSGVGVGKAFAITDKCENPEVLIAWIDYLYSEEGGTVMRIGLEGQDYFVTENNTWYNAEGFNYKKQALIGYAQVPAFEPDFYYDNMDAEKNPIESYIQGERFGEDGVFTTGYVMPPLSYTVEEQETMSTLRTDILSYINNYQAKVIVGEFSLEDTWDEFQDTLKKMNVDELSGIYKAAYERSIAD